MKEFINPGEIYSSGRAYSKAVKIDIGDSEMIFISGQIPKNEKGEIVGKDNIVEQIEYTFGRLKSILEEAGALFDDLVQVNTYLTDISEFEEFSKIRNKYLKNAKPAATTVEISATAFAGCRIEIDAIAIKKK
jgi:reactive intermediate/imine deaminase